MRFKRTLEVSPVATVSQAGSRRATFPRTTGFFDNRPVGAHIGANRKALLSPGTILDVAINPDFAEVEADAPVITENQRFPNFFEERRPFFLEGSEIFQTALQTFHSRTVVDPIFAAKATFRNESFSAGLIAAMDEAPGNYNENELVDPISRRRSEEFRRRKAFSAVDRGRMNYGRENSVGAFSSVRLFPEQRNGVFAIDGKNKLTDGLTFNYQAVFTRSSRCFLEPDFEPLLDTTQADRNRAICQTGADPQAADPHSRYRAGNGIGYLLSLDSTRRNRGWYLEASGRTKDYRADLGFERRTNTNRLYFSNRFSTEAKPKSSVVRLDWRQFASLSYDFDGRSQASFVGTHVTINLQRNTRLMGEAGIGYERLIEEEFGLKRMPSRPLGAFNGDSERSAVQRWTEIRLASQPSKWLTFEGFINHAWRTFDLDRGGGPRFPRVSPAAILNPNSALDPGPGDNFRTGIRVELKPLERLRIFGSFQQSRLVRNDTGMTVFDTGILTLGSAFHFTRFTFLRSRWDYNSSSGSVLGQVLFGWNPSPGKALYFGYNDNLNHNGFNPFTFVYEPGSRRNSRAVFVRWSHLFRKSF